MDRQFVGGTMGTPAQSPPKRNTLLEEADHNLETANSLLGRVRKVRSILLGVEPEKESTGGPVAVPSSLVDKGSELRQINDMIGNELARIELML